MVRVRKPREQLQTKASREMLKRPTIMVLWHLFTTCFSCFFSCGSRQSEDATDAASGALLKYVEGRKLAELGRRKYKGRRIGSWGRGTQGWFEDDSQPNHDCGISAELRNMVKETIGGAEHLNRMRSLPLRLFLL